MGSQSVGYHQMPLETGYHTAVGRLCVNSPPDLRVSEWEAFDINVFAFGGFGGFTFMADKNFFIFCLFLPYRKTIGKI